MMDAQSIIVLKMEQLCTNKTIIAILSLQNQYANLATIKP